MRVQRQRARHAPAERLAKYEVECGNGRQFVTHDIAAHHLAEMRLDPLGAQHRSQMLIVSGVVTDDGDIQRIALIAGPRMRKFT
ncbi:hypothetical protein KCU90_g2942, partial [Aureobasidium melanogenum]